MDTVFSLSDVQVTMGETPIIGGMSWQHRIGEHWAVIGPNGAGKTTLSKVLTGRLPVSSGSVSVLGEPITEYDPYELNSLVGFTSAALVGRIRPRQTVLDTVLAAAQGRDQRFKESYDDVDFGRAEDLLAAFSVSSLRDRTFGTLSHGEKQRVLVARAFMADPQALVLDEPASGLDLGSRENLMMALTELAGDHRSPAMLLVTHHLEQIPTGFTHAMILKDGAILHAGPITETLTSDHLSEAFDLPIEVGSDRGRWWARGRM